ncbi:nuclease-related domain-containing protein [Neobacillus notoginsengisoli]|uniref:nuclease-related domain-containing protein n=1 Tax=Neobacillus notoginsengisoli TaxID=1578198 RepID=UPI001F016D10|nr:nuclease-related domain-containing protein [Neobacillus notoginsengisoli]
MAEIYSKISKSGSNLSERLEDKLTGDFFGTIRYLPFELGLKQVLTTTDFTHKQAEQKWMKFIEKEKGFATQIEFWYRDDEGEIDLLITTEKMIIGIEVKYLSGISSEDHSEEIAIDYRESVHQLARYSRMIERLSKGRKSYLLFLAPYDMMNQVKKKVLERPIIAPTVEIGFISWQDIHESLLTLDISNIEIGPQRIIKDLRALLKIKGLMQFNGFNSPVFLQLVTKEAYSFNGEYFINQTAFNWPSKFIKEDEKYVYNYSN